MSPLVDFEPFHETNAFAFCCYLFFLFFLYAMRARFMTKDEGTNFSLRYDEDIVGRMPAYCVTISFPLVLFLFLGNDMMIRRLKDGFSQTRPHFLFLLPQVDNDDYGVLAFHSSFNSTSFNLLLLKCHLPGSTGLRFLRFNFLHPFFCYVAGHVAGHIACLA